MLILLIVFVGFIIVAIAIGLLGDTKTFNEFFNEHHSKPTHQVYKIIQDNKNRKEPGVYVIYDMITDETIIQESSTVIGDLYKEIKHYNNQKKLDTMITLYKLADNKECKKLIDLKNKVMYEFNTTTMDEDIEQVTPNPTIKLNIKTKENE